jgi:hypothetical protein
MTGIAILAGRSEQVFDSARIPDYNAAPLLPFAETPAAPPPGSPGI